MQGRGETRCIVSKEAVLGESHEISADDRAKLERVLEAADRQENGG